MSYISFDSSTSSTTVLVFNEKLEIVKRFQKEHKQIYTPEGFIEHDLEEIYQNLIALIKEASNINNRTANPTKSKNGEINRTKDELVQE